jgi:hypothetical protein
MYERQQTWRKAVQAKTSIQREERQREANEATFSPHMYAPRTGAADHTVNDNLRRSSQTHRDRQEKARKEKKEIQQRLQSGSKPNEGSLNHSFVTASTGESAFPTSNYEDFARLMENERATGLSSTSSRGEPTNRELSEIARRTAGLSMNNHLYGSENGDVNIPVSSQQEIFDVDEEPIVEILERERREWHAERVKLIHCIHMQQLELAHRAAAANTQAVEIAKDFAQTVESFEERLVSVEDNVHKEILAIKAIAESLQSTVGMLVNQSSIANGNSNNNNIEANRHSTL